MSSLVASSAAILRLIGLRHLRHRWRRTLLTATGIACGVALVVAVTVTHSTLVHAIDSVELGTGSGRDLTVRPIGAPSFEQSKTDVARRVRGVAAATPFVRQISTAQRGGRRVRSLFLGVSSSGSHATGARTLPAVDGLFLSSAMAHRLSATIGSLVLVGTPSGPARIRVTAIVRTGLGTAVNGGVYALLSLPEAQRLFERPGRVDEIAIQVRPGVRRGDVRATLARQLGPTVRVETEADVAAPFKRTFSTIAATTRLVSLLALLVAALLVLNTQSMSLTERHREICLLRLAGAQPFPFIIAFVAEAVIIGIVAGAIGVEAGVRLAQARLEDARSAYAGVLPLTAVGPVAVSWLQVIGGIACGGVVAGGGAILTIHRILAVTPIELLRPKAAYAIAEAQDRRPVSVPGAVGLLAVAGTLLLTATASGTLSMAVSAVALLVMVAGGALVLPSFVRATSAALRFGLLDRIGPTGWLAGGGIARAPGRTIFAVGALTLSATVALASGSAMGSFETATRQSAERWYPAPLYARAPGANVLGADQPVEPATGRRLTAVPGVRAAYPVRFAIVDHARSRVIILVFPFAEAARRGDTLTRDVPATDRPLVDALASGSVLASRPLAAREHLSRGAKLTLSTAHGPRRFVVAGFFDSINPVGEVYMDRSVYRAAMDDDRADFFAVWPARGADAGDTTTRLRRTVADRHIPVHVMTRAETTGQVVGTVGSVFAMANVIRVSALIIVGLTVAATMLTAMFERQRETGLLRLIGMGRVRFAACALLEAICVAGMAALLATGLGLGLGYLILAAAELQLGMRLPFHPDVATIGAVVAYTLLPACLAAIYASWRCSRPSITQLLAPRG